MKYDAPFIFAEVNADLAFWVLLPDGQRLQASVNKKTVGRNISTKSVYGDTREDVTAHYKYPEGDPVNRDNLITFNKDSLIHLNSHIKIVQG